MGGMLPNAQPQHGLIVFGDFVHMAVGWMVAFRLRLAGDAALAEAMCACSRPALAGNVPTTRFLLSQRATGQVRPEID
ncbi:hypothetical protein J7355_01180 [Endozoicomonas sp. G2_2]|uniref:hypothetical protein n=1 Tax=Endozoicomonas sp. G2_2 TaxID=2821092 RepID=UPI001ADD2890|nr:hypothetical protein [Endozoicomonas sp. G2_2]MBO9468701.1 hypothetical protein [Endozoicomonas sp. G2_2]